MASKIRSRILEVAAQELMNSGGKGLVLRSVAERSATTTQAIYTQFGGKQGLVEALLNDGWSRLTAKLQNLKPNENPLEYLMEIGLCYFRFANENPNFYQLMVGRSVPNLSLPERQEKYTGPWRKFTAVALRQAISRGLLSGRVEDIGFLLWATCHGMIDLKLNGFVQHKNDETLLRRAAIGILRDFAGPAFTSETLPRA